MKLRLFPPQPEDKAKLCRNGILHSLLLVAAIALAPATLSGAPKQPNILIIFADDQCFETIGALGHTDIETPHLDRLVREGTTFTRAYNMGSWSGAVCVASRCMLITGRNLWNANRVYKHTANELKAGRFWPSYMRGAGYRTYFTGKWHIRADAAKAFDVARHVRGGMPNQTPQGYNRPLPGKPDPWSPYDPQFEGFWKGGKHWSEVVADDTVQFLDDARKRDNPFFMYIAFNAAHDPRQSPKEYVDKYPPSRIKLPENFLPEYPYKDAIGCGAKLRDEKLGPFPRTKHAVKVHRGEYYAIVTHMDAQIGRILDKLHASGMAGNTYIFFTADHGLGVGHHGLFGKQNLYEHSTRVPFIAVGPGIQKNRKFDGNIYLQDVMPTTLELAGLQKPDHVQFHSLMPLLNGASQRSPYEAVYGGYLNLQRSVTWKDHKLILYPKIARARLYNLKHDPLEMDDLAGNPGQAARARKLFSRLLDLQREMEDPLDLKAAFPGLL